MASHPPRHARDLIETFPIRAADGTDLVGHLYRFEARRGGRRIVVEDLARRVVFDTDESFDLANATNALDLWLAEHHPRAELAVPELRCALCGVVLAGLGNEGAAEIGGTTADWDHICERCAWKAVAPEVPCPF